MTFGFSRDDAGKFLKVYQEKKILEKDPFSSVDVEGVGAIVRTAIELGRRTRPDLPRGFRAPWVPVLPIASICATLSIFAASF